MSEPENFETAAKHKSVDHIDYHETHDITEVHAAVQREKNEPAFGQVPVPLWLMALGGVAVIWAGAYLGMFNGGFRGDVFNERDTSPKLLFPDQSATASGNAASSEAAVETPAEQGKKVFTANCVSCHQASGMGIPGQYPPLVKSEFVNGGSKRLGMILLKGLQGPVKVEGVTYNGAMPQWETVLNDKKIANVLTYIRQEWGNTSGEITPEQITAARKELSDRKNLPWAEADLLAVPVTDEWPGGKPAGETPPAKPEAKK